MWSILFSRSHGPSTLRLPNLQTYSPATQISLLFYLCVYKFIFSISIIHELILPNQGSVSPAPTPCRHTLGMWGTACSPLHQSGCSLYFLMKGLSGSTPAPGQSLTTPLCWCKGPPTSPPGVIGGPDTGVIN